MPVRSDRTGSSSRSRCAPADAGRDSHGRATAPGAVHPAPGAVGVVRLAARGEGRGRAPRVGIRSARVPELPMQDAMPGADREPLTVRRAAGWALVAGLCVAAAVAVAAVLTGSFDDTD